MLALRVTVANAGYPDHENSRRGGLLRYRAGHRTMHFADDRSASEGSPLFNRDSGWNWMILSFSGCGLKT